MQTFHAFSLFGCVYLGIRAGGSTPVMAYPRSGGNPSSALWQPIDPNPFDTTQPHPHVTWATPSVRTSTFSGHAGDSLSYTRFFRMGTFTAGDTAAVQAGLDTTSDDYFRASINLRRAADSAILLVLDTALLTRSNFVSSTNIADSGFGHAVIPVTDSFFLTMDVARGDSNDNLTLAHIESYGDPIQDILPASDSTTGGPAPKISTPTTAVLDTVGLQVTVHPNPANNQTRICVLDLPGGVPASVQVVNMNGEVVATLYNATPDAELGLCLTLDSSKLPSGVYYAYIQNEIMGRAVKIVVEH